MELKPSYRIDGRDILNFGVRVSASSGLVSRPRIKQPASVKFNDEHGENVDLAHKYYEPREIMLSCFIMAKSTTEFVSKLNRFYKNFDKPGTTRLMIVIDPQKPLVYEVYCKDPIEVVKEWTPGDMIGTFRIKLIEPQPVKRVLRHTAIDASTYDCKLMISTDKAVNVYWGDGMVDYDIVGKSRILTHKYSYGEFYPIIAGDIDAITDFQTTGKDEIIWQKI